jgi:hypothetical protein
MFVRVREILGGLRGISSQVYFFTPGGIKFSWRESDDGTKAWFVDFSLS